MFSTPGRLALGLAGVALIALAIGLLAPAGCNDGSTGCCVMCSGSCPCGDSCAPCGEVCTKVRGCACDEASAALRTSDAAAETR
jgi:hypothetical protein